MGHGVHGVECRVESREWGSGLKKKPAMGSFPLLILDLASFFVSCISQQRGVTWHFVLYTLHLVPRAPHSMLHTLHSAPHAPHSVLCTLHCAPCALHPVLCTLCPVPCAPCSTPQACALHSTLYTLHSMLYTLCSTLCALCSMLHALCTMGGMRVRGTGVGV